MIQVLKDKIKANPNNPKVLKWRQIIADTEKAKKNKTQEIKQMSENTVANKIRSNLVKPPEDEQTRIRKDYLRSVLYPDDHTTRMPDEVTQPTSLYRSVREFNLIANMDGTANSGRFSFAVKPILGSIDNIHHFQVGIVDNNAGWPQVVAYSQAGSYVSNNLYSDPRVDPMIAPLTSGPLGYVAYSGTTNLGINYTSLIPDANIVDVSKGNLLINYYTIANTTVTPFHATFAGFTFNIDRPDAANCPVVAFSVETGVYTFKNIIHQYGSWTTTGPRGQGVLIALDENNECVGYVQANGGTVDAHGVFVGSISRLWDFDATIYNTNQGLIADEIFNVRLNSRYRYIPTYLSGSNGTGQSVTTGIFLASTQDSSLSTISDNGSIIKLRPIACSVLVTNTLPDINAGGNIVAYSAPSADIDNYYYRTSAQLGPYQEWENLARTNKGQLLHDGNFKDGCYVWSQPWDKNDCLLRTPTEANDYAYQGIIVSGQINPSVALTGSINCGRIRICMTYEYTSDNRLFPGESCYGTTADLDWVLSYLGAQKHAYENKTHLSSLTNIMSKSLGLITKSVPTVMKAVDMAGKVAGALL